MSQQGKTISAQWTGTATPTAKYTPAEFAHQQAIWTPAPGAETVIDGLKMDLMRILDAYGNKTAEIAPGKFADILHRISLAWICSTPDLSRLDGASIRRELTAFAHSAGWPTLVAALDAR